MAIVINSTFTPYTYEEIAAPIREMREEHAKLQDTIDTYSTTAAKIKNLINATDDPNEWELYQSYSRALNDAADQLSTKGVIDGSIRRKISNLKTQFAENIEPIGVGAEARIKDMEAYDKRTPGQVWNYNPYEKSISDYSNGRRPEKVIGNGQNAYTMAAKGATAASARMYTRELGDMLGVYRQIIETTGVNSEQARAWRAQVEDMSGSDPVMKELNEILTRAVDMNGGANMDKNSDAYAELFNWGIAGIMDGLAYQQKTSMQKDDEAYIQLQQRYAPKVASGRGSGSGGSGRSGSRTSSGKSGNNNYTPRDSYEVHGKDLEINDSRLSGTYKKESDLIQRIDKAVTEANGNDISIIEQETKQVSAGGRYAGTRTEDVDKTDKYIKDLNKLALKLGVIKSSGEITTSNAKDYIGEIKAKALDSWESALGVGSVNRITVSNDSEITKNIADRMQFALADSVISSNTGKKGEAKNLEETNKNLKSAVWIKNSDGSPITYEDYKELATKGGVPDINPKGVFILRGKNGKNYIISDPTPLIEGMSFFNSALDAKRAWELVTSTNSLSRRFTGRSSTELSEVKNVLGDLIRCGVFTSEESREYRDSIGNKLFREGKVTSLNFDEWTPEQKALLYKDWLNWGVRKLNGRFTNDYVDNIWSVRQSPQNSASKEGEAHFDRG